jgi:DNA polymerase-3 subunit chi
MTTTIQFYHLTSTPALRAVPKLMEKALGSGARVVMLLKDSAQLRSMSDALWTHNPDGFLPHESADSATAPENPIVLSLNDTNPNDASILCVLGGAQPESVARYAKVLDIFDGADADALTAARGRWASYKAQGFTLQYVKQDPKGGWKIEAEAA